MGKLALTGYLAIFYVLLFFGTLVAQPIGPAGDGKVKDEKMEIDLTIQEKQKIEETFWEKYGKVAVSPEGQFKYPTGLA